MRTLTALIAVAALAVACKKKEEAPASVAPVPKSPAPVQMAAPVEKPAPAPMEAAPMAEEPMKTAEKPMKAVEEPQFISSHAAAPAPVVTMRPVHSSRPVRSSSRPTPENPPPVMKEEPMAVSIVPGIADTGTTAEEPPPAVKKEPSTSTSGLYPSGAPASLRSFMQRRQSKVESCFRKALATGRMLGGTRYMVTIGCKADAGRLSITGVGGSASQVSTFKRCVSRLGGTYADTAFSRNWTFTMHLIP